MPASIRKSGRSQIPCLRVSQAEDTYHVIGVIFFVLNFQLIMAGRPGSYSEPEVLRAYKNLCSDRQM